MMGSTALLQRVGLTPLVEAKIMRTIIKSSQPCPPAASQRARCLEAPVSTVTQTEVVTELYRAHHGWLNGWLRRRLGNASDAADLAQDAFLRVIRARNADLVVEPRHYLATIAKGLVVDLFRRRSLESQYLELLAQQPEQEWPSPETRALVVEAVMEIDRMLDGLGPRVKQAFLLAQCDGLTYPEIAARLEISLRTVNNYMARAMEHCCLYQLQQAGE